MPRPTCLSHVICFSFEQTTFQTPLSCRPYLKMKFFSMLLGFVVVASTAVASPFSPVCCVDCPVCRPRLPPHDTEIDKRLPGLQNIRTSKPVFSEALHFRADSATRGAVQTRCYRDRELQQRQNFPAFLGSCRCRWTRDD